ncbi:hypothetical protein [Verrucosispora sp. WMMC514]|uniref:hypothetical protein n=1 Tax=Verrucosispora sp. WMMC514 TaxID=3015156 RepID=UPI00248C4B86|nr:hypothetical protein [Verrucosispora sp. WMMC514]WBB91455.1 hypothetical protein O7597_31615 [Verrucosispora sp. WMMC514]WBB91486.1 hypothetical protein O7597_00070 [Verrucosispora sp. WMMC514]
MKDHPNPTDTSSGALPEQTPWTAEQITDLLHAGFQQSRGAMPDDTVLHATADLIAQQVALLRRADTDLITTLRGALTQADDTLRDSNGALEYRYQQFVGLVRRWIIWAVNTGALSVAEANTALHYLTMPPPLRTHFEATVHTPLAVDVDAATTDDAVASAQHLLRVDLRSLDAVVHPTEPWQLRLRVLDQPPTHPDQQQYRYRVVWVVPLVVTVKALDHREAIPIAVDMVTADLDHLDVAHAYTADIRAVDITPVHHGDYDPTTD